MVFLCFHKGLINSLCSWGDNRKTQCRIILCRIFLLEIWLTSSDGATSFSPWYFFFILLLVESNLFCECQGLLFGPGTWSWQRIERRWFERGDTGLQLRCFRGKWGWNRPGTSAPPNPWIPFDDLTNSPQTAKSWGKNPLVSPKRKRKPAEFMASAVTRGTARRFRELGEAGISLGSRIWQSQPGEFCCTSISGCFGWHGTLGDIFWNAHCTSTWFGDSSWQGGVD